MRFCHVWVIAVCLLAACSSAAELGVPPPGREAARDAAPDAPPDAPPDLQCAKGELVCEGGCVDVRASVGHCGACGRACASGEVCEGGACALSCAAGTTACSGSCFDTQTSSAHCGRCGSACGGDERCMGGTCACRGLAQRCGGRCVDTRTDPANCGACDRACATGQACADGQCERVCAAGQARCGDRCVRLDDDASNCGACDVVCPAGRACVAGACACPTGQTLCAGACASTGNDPANCGVCGNTCLSGQACSGGRCVRACAADETRCGDACARLDRDRDNCGACGSACPAAQTCVAGVCACPAGQTLCAGACANSATDRAHCGRCGNACPAAQTCVAGACVCPPRTTLCSEACVDTSSDGANCGRCGAACAAGSACVGGACRGPAPANDTRAGATAIDMASPSVTLSADTTSARNDTVGPCGCTSGNDVFFRFTLTQPEIVYADTLGALWDTSLFIQSLAGVNVTDAGTPNGLACNDDIGFCSTGLRSQILARLGAGAYILGLSGCGAGPAQIHFQHLPAGNGPSARIAPGIFAQTVTGAVSGTGAVASLCCSGGPDNSYWWVTCPNAVAASFHATSCNVATGANQSTYDMEIAQYSALRAGAAVQVCNDDTGLMCGFGSTVNSTIPATGASQAGLNVLVADTCIGSGMYTINYIMANCASGVRCGSLCADVNSDANHCGGCNRRCSTGQMCVRGACVSSCASGTTPCSGVCVNLMTDPANCGTCGQVCRLDHATSACTSGACRVGACRVGWANCNGNAADGCETALVAFNHCGACGRACASGQACNRMGACVAAGSAGTCGPPDYTARCPNGSACPTYSTCSSDSMYCNPNAGYTQTDCTTGLYCGACAGVRYWFVAS